VKVKMLTLLLVITVPLAAFTLAAPQTAQAARTWTVVAGGGTRDLTVVLNAFYPRRLHVATGDTVTWQVEGFHNIAFLGGGQAPPLEVQEGGNTYINPQVAFPAGGKTYEGTGYANSGVPQDPSKPFAYSLTFTKAGSYSYLCIIHGPSMGGEIVVGDQTSGSPEAVLAGARQEQAAGVKAGQTAFASLKPDWTGYTVNVPLIGSVKDGYSILRFTPRPIVIPRGATVKWTMADPYEIHTVTFTSGAKPPEHIIVEPQQQGPPKLMVNPKSATPAGGKAYDGTGFVNSGILFPPGLPGNLPTSYSLTFTKPGRYEYVCIVHLPFMTGTVIVK
jgi:plastocyanin